MTVLRYLRSAPVVVDAGFSQGVGTSYTPCNAVVLHAPKQGASSMALCLSDVESLVALALHRLREERLRAS